MFENLLTNIKRKLNKTADETPTNFGAEKKSGFKRSFNLLKSKFLKPSPLQIPVNNYSDNLALSPRAVSNEYALTEIDWPILTDNNPNILDRFTRIITINYDEVYDKKVRTK